MNDILKHRLQKIAYIIVAISVLINSILVNAAEKITTSSNEHATISVKVTENEGEYSFIMTVFNSSNEYFLNGKFILEDISKRYDNTLAISPYYEISRDSSRTATATLTIIPPKGHDCVNVVWSYSDDGHHPEEEVYRLIITVYLPDTTSPTVILTPNTTAWATSNLINITTTDNIGVTGLNINGTVLTVGTSTYPVYTNGVYTISATDAEGNVGSNSITISNIDTLKPNVKITLGN